MKQGILVISFGSSHLQAIERAIVPMEQDFRDAFPDFQIFRAFTSSVIRRKLKETKGIVIDDPRSALEKMRQEGIEEVIVQPLFIVPGKEYQKIFNLVEEIRDRKEFKNIVCGRSLLHFNGQEGCPDDYHEISNMVAQLLPDPEPREAVLLVGHGSPESANAAYELLGYRIQKRWPWIYLANIGGGPDLASHISQFQSEGHVILHVIPFMWVAGEHAHADIAGEQEDSWKSILTRAGFTVECHLFGLGEREEMRRLFLNRARDAWEISKSKEKV